MLKHGTLSYSSVVISSKHFALYSLYKCATFARSFARDIIVHWPFERCDLRYWHFVARERCVCVVFGDFLGSWSSLKLQHTHTHVNGRGGASQTSAAGWAKLHILLLRLVWMEWSVSAAIKCERLFVYERSSLSGTTTISVVRVAQKMSPAEWRWLNVALFVWICLLWACLFYLQKLS